MDKLKKLVYFPSVEQIYNIPKKHIQVDKNIGFKFTFSENHLEIHSINKARKYRGFAPLEFPYEHEKIKLYS
jgi:hypothetical protein